MKTDEVVIHMLLYKKNFNRNLSKNQYLNFYITLYCTVYRLTLMSEFIFPSKKCRTHTSL